MMLIVVLIVVGEYYGFVDVKEDDYSKHPHTQVVNMWREKMRQG